MTRKYNITPKAPPMLVYKKNTALRWGTRLAHSILYRSGIHKYVQRLTTPLYVGLPHGITHGKTLPPTRTDIYNNPTTENKVIT